MNARITSTDRIESQIVSTLGDFAEDFRVSDMARQIISEGFTSIDEIDPSVYNSLLPEYAL